MTLGPPSDTIISMLRLHLLPVLLLLTLLPTQLQAEESPWPPLPETMLKDAEAAMFINRPRQLIQNLEDGGTEAGVAVDMSLSLISQQVYRSWSLAGIDLDRPAMLLWRKGNAPLTAIIPISDREQFTANFGRVLDASAMMIRVGEDAGTTVYKQNTETGSVEYRLLIRDNTAFLGRSAPECKVLSEITLQEETSAPMYRFYIDSPYDFFPRISDQLGISTDPLESEIKNLIASEWDLLLQQINDILITASLDARQRLDLRCRISPVTDSTMALWASRQQNQSSRLLSLLDYEKSALAVYGNINWAGGIKEMSARIAKFVERFGKDDAAVTHARALSAWGNLFDRQGAFAQCLHLRTTKPGELDVYSIAAQEQPRAIELLGYQQIIDTYIAAFSNKQLEDEEPTDTPGKDDDVGDADAVGMARVSDLESVGAQQAYWKSSVLPGGSTSYQLVMAADAHRIDGWGFGGKEAISERSLAVAKQLDQSVSPIGHAGIVVAHVKLHNVLREISNLSGSLGYQIDEAEITASMSLDNDRNIIFKLDFPIADVARSIRASDWTAVMQQMTRLFQQNSK